ncbi:Hpt domain-containing protein [Arthrobacter sp. CAN_C5]|uniref:Hpt domain-containing protein n=1 Tax=Arthrobacter sp. CAN_C5 TaxID=2760706 RepID=UPI001AE62AB8|nr:Hpt domain-containing protein [Arthrobacter sp. CAN_C5]MBP2215722.1 HPt (histidine-containing phosphotransfer) domain-containing protein [Arthrobacter sp. CAN_C5]
MRVVTVPEREELPLVDRQILALLGDHIDNPTALKSFVLDFVDAWDDRYLRLTTDLEDHSGVAAVDAILSIKTTATMVGASRLADLAADLENLIRVDEYPAAAALLPRLHSCALQTIEALLREAETNG